MVLLTCFFFGVSSVSVESLSTVVLVVGEIFRVLLFDKEASSPVLVVSKCRTVEMLEDRKLFHIFSKLQTSFQTFLVTNSST